MHTGVDVHGFVNTLEIAVVFRKVETLVCFDQRQTVGNIAVDFVRGRKNKNRPGAEPAHRFKQNHGACRIDAEIDRGLLGGLIVGRLGRGMHDQDDIPAVFSE